MALNINTIVPASLKAKQVATEEYVDTGLANIDVSGDIGANNDEFAQSLGFAAGNGYTAYENMVNNTQLGKTLISGGYINTGLVKASSILANSVSADRLMAGTNATTVWNGGGLVSANFNGNPYGSIGSPTRGFRLSSNAAGTSADPNIYGAYIKGGIIESSIFKGALLTPTVYDSVGAAPGINKFVRVASFNVSPPSSGESFKVLLSGNYAPLGGTYYYCTFRAKINGVIIGSYPMQFVFGGGELTRFWTSSTSYTSTVNVTIEASQSSGGYSNAHTSTYINVMALATAE